MKQIYIKFIIMEYNILKIKDIKFKTWLIALGAFIIAAPVVWMMLARLEGTNPYVVLEPASLSLGLSQEITITATDAKPGLRKAWIGLLKDGKETVLFQKEYPSPGITGSDRVVQDTFSVRIEPKKLGITDGKAILRLALWDNSWRGWMQGNKAYIEKDVSIDTVPPRIRVLTRFHNVSQGGAGLVIYSLTEPCPRNGVYVGDSFFAGYSGNFSDKRIHMAYFALDYSQGPEAEFYITAVDAAGNSARSGFPHYVRKRSFKKDVIALSDSFLSWKMPEFDVPGAQNADLSLSEKFLKVNRDLRQSSYQQLIKETDKTESKLLWTGDFLRLPNSARQAGFADHRAYNYNGRTIDRQVHLGVDLAATAHSPVPAANSGKVAFVGDIGIYGRTVIIDHGFGLFSMYSHLSGADVQSGETVDRGTIIGNTGVTGLAGGDHLHFGMMIHHAFVDPIEWWDAAWIKNNITDKISSVKSTLGAE